MPKEMDRYGAVKVVSGKFKGRIGYYDDDDLIFPEDFEWDENDSLENNENIIPVAIVYFGNFLLATEHYAIPYDDLDYPSMNDLMRRKDELTELCSPFNIKNRISYKKLSSYF